MKTLNPQLTRTLVLIGLLIVGGGSSFSLYLRQMHSGKTPQRAATTAEAPAPAATPATHLATKPATPTRAAAKPVARSTKPVARGNLVDARLPAPLQWELSQHRIVVVSFYNPESEVDAISVSEAHQGAVDAKVGFLLVSVLDNAVAGPLTGLLPGGGLLPNPGVLVYRAPGRVVYRFDGFADRETVAQAAADAQAGAAAASVVDPGVATSATGAIP